MSFQITKYPYAPIIINNGLNILSIQSPIEFFNLVEGLQNENEEVIVSQDNKIKKIGKDTKFFGDITTLINLNKIYSKEIGELIIKYLDESSIFELNELNSKFNSVLSNLILTNDLPLSFNLEFDIKEFIKQKNLILDLPIVKNPYDKIQSVIDILSEFNDKDLLIFTNSFQYLNNEQIDYLARDIELKELKVLFIERSDLKLTTNEAKNVQFIDKDFIQI